MSTKTIGQLPPSALLPSDTLIEVEISGASQRVSLDDLKRALFAGYVPPAIPPETEETIRQISETVQAVEQAIGSAVTAAESAAQSEIARRAAVAARGVTETNDRRTREARGIAEQKAADAAQSAAGAAGFARTAEGSAILATQRADDAGEAAALITAEISTATTAAGEARRDAAAALTSERNADQSAVSASESSGLAATAAGQAGISATGAFNSAAAASTKADAAGVSATAAQQDRISAEAARDTAAGKAAVATDKAAVATDKAAAALASAETAASYAAGGYSDATARAGVERVERGYAAADTQLASRASVLESTASSSAGFINVNPRFALWPLADLMPSYWTWWNRVFSIQRIARSDGISGYAARISSNAGEDGGLWDRPLPLFPGWYVLDAEVELINGSYVGSGVTIQGYPGIHFATDADMNGDISPTRTGRRRFTRLVYLPDTCTNWHAMNGWAGWVPLASISAKTIDWYRCSVRPASDAEIKAQKADSALNNPGGVLARIKGTEDAFSDLPNKYAAAKRADDLEAQINGEAGSRLLSRANASAAVVADQKAGAVAQSLGQLRTEYDGTAAEVIDQRGSISGLKGRTAAYVRFITVAGSNRAQLTLSADANGGAGADLVGDLSLHGNLVIPGSVGTIQIGSNSVTIGGGSTASGSVVLDYDGNGPWPLLNTYTIALPYGGTMIAFASAYVGHPDSDVGNIASTMDITAKQIGGGTGFLRPGRKSEYSANGSMREVNGQISLPAGTWQIDFRAITGFGAPSYADERKLFVFASMR